MNNTHRKYYEASAPSNIALIKYMGKILSDTNVPTNSSLSWMLDDLRTFVRITPIEEAQDRWALLQDSRIINYEMKLSDRSIARFLKHFQFLKKEWSIEQNFLVESGNNFPSDCGLASSASSFAALTQASVLVFQDIAFKPDVNESEVASLSRVGSGSSCRSFFGPWTLWYKEGVRPLEFPYSCLAHQVIVVEDAKKEVSSSEAHRRVITSDLFKGRPERAEKRLAELRLAFKQEDWRKAYEICWTEFWDMHALFETSSEPFGYMTPSSLDVLQYAKDIWKLENDGPIVTMDAGANVHFLWRPEQSRIAKRVEQDLSKKYRVISCRQLAEVKP